MKTNEKKQERENYVNLSSFCMRNGMALFGVAKLSSLKGAVKFLPEEVLEKLRYGISLGFRLSDSIIEGINDRPTEIYFHHYKQVNYFLDRAALQVVNMVQSEGYGALPVPASQVVNRERQEGHLPHKILAVSAGMGWIGRNNLLVNPQFGSRIRLVSILTDFPLTVDEPLDRDCGDCRLCINCCPVSAIKDKPRDFDHLACFRQLEVFRRRYSIGHHICGICVKACAPCPVKNC